ncbi:MAG: DUF4403 family protein [Cyclobacteriaceae bacterium]|jgi:hypothetical protein
MKLRSFTAILILLSAAGLFRCSRVAPPAPERTQVDSVLQVGLSHLNIPVFFPVRELEKIANEKLQARIFEAHVPISKKNDTVDLAISRFKPLSLAYDGKRGITYVVPLQVDGMLRSRVAGIKIQNKIPITAQVLLTLYSDLYLDNDWNLSPKTKLINLEWVQEPRVNVAGIKVNLTGPLEKALRNNEDKLTTKLDQTVRESAPIRRSVEKLWRDIQKPIRINRKIVPAWLKVDADDMNARLFFHSKDTLILEVGLAARIRTLLDSASAPVTKKALPNFKRKPENSPGLSASVKVTLPFDKLNEVLHRVTDTMRIAFQGREIRIKEAEVYGTDTGVAVRLALRGDLRAEVYLRGTVGFDSVENRVTIQNFAFDVNSDQALLSAANWLAHDVIIDKLQPYLSLPMKHTFDALPDLITKGIEKGKLGSKINVYIPNWEVAVDQTLITRNDIQLILQARGLIAVGLEEGLFEKKKASRP